MAKTRPRIIFERWFTLALYAVAGAGSYLLLDRFLLGGFLALVREEWSLRLSAAGLLLIALARLGIDMHPRLARVVWFLPPVWFAGILGAVVLVLSGPVLGLSHKFAFPWLTALVLLLVPAVWIAWGRLLSGFLDRRALQKERTPKSTMQGATSIEELDESQLVKWLESDDEIKRPEQDRFGAAIAARRIAERLRKSFSSSVAIVGDIGSGKSSLAELVRVRLYETDSDIIFVRVSLWPFETSEAAVKGVLSTLVRALDGRAPTLSVRTLPQSYVRSVEGSGTFGEMVGPHLAGRSPQEVVEEIDDLLVAASFRVVICIEDLERFGGLSTDSSADDRLAPVYSMLYQLDDADNISVLISATALHMRLDAHKMVRFVERMPMLEPEATMDIVMEVREYCRRISPDGMIEVLPDSERKYLPRDERWSWYWLSDLTRRAPLFPECIVHLLCTPRMMKSALRLFVERWRAVGGEADIDHVLVVSIIQCAVPEVFAFIESRVHAFRRDGTDPPIAVQDNPMPDLREDLEKVLSRITDARKAAAVRQLVGFLFPQSKIGRLVQPSSHPQGVSLANPTDYWKRIIEEPDISYAESDQRLLRVLQNWKDGLDEELAVLAVDGQWTGRLRQFRRQLKAGDLCRLLEAVAAIHARQDGSNWDHSDPSGIVATCLLCLDSRIRSSMLADTLLRIINRHGANHLPLLSSVAYWFVATRQSSPDPVDSPDDRRRVRQAITGAMLDAIDSPESFASALRCNSVYTLLHLTFADWRELDDLNAIWPSIRDALVRLVRFYPELARSQTIPLLVDTDHRGGLVETDDGWHPTSRTVTRIRSNVGTHFSDDDICAIFAGTDFVAFAELYPELQHAIPAVAEYVAERCSSTRDCGEGTA